MAMDDNPFAAGGATFASSGGGGGTLEPVPMDAQSILTRCWELFTSNPGVVLAAVLIPAVPAFVIGLVDAGLQMAAMEADPDAQLAFSMGRLGLSGVSTVIGVFFQLGVVRIFLNLARGEEAEVGMLVGGGSQFLAGLGATILMGLAVLAGFVLLIIPGIILALGLQFTMYTLVDRNLGPVEALTESWRLTDGHKVAILIVNFLIGLMVLAFSCITLGFGYLLAIPVVSLSQAVMYHTLTTRYSSDVSLAGPRA